MKIDIKFEVFNFKEEQKETFNFYCNHLRDKQRKFLNLYIYIYIKKKFQLGQKNGIEEDF